jgi:TnpA family transposase
MGVFLYTRRQKIMDDLVDLFILLVGKLSKRAEKKVVGILIKEIKRVHGKTTLLARIAEAALKDPKGTVDKVIYPIADKVKLSDIVKEYKYSGKGFKKEVHKLVRSSYSSHYRRMVPKILGSLKFKSNNAVHAPILDAIDWLLDNPITGSKFSMDGSIPIADIIKPSFLDMVKGGSKDDMDRIDYEIAVLRALRKRLRCKEIWVDGADRYRSPEEDVPKDFSLNRDFYYDRLGAENDPLQFTKGLKEEMKTALRMLNAGMPSNEYVRFRETTKKSIILSPLEPLTEPPNINALKGQIRSRWPMTSLLEILREADSWSGFTDSFKSIRTSERLDPDQLRKRLLLVLYGLGTNTGLKRLGSGNQVSYKELRHVKNAYIHKESLRRAIREVANGVFSIKETKLWGAATTACASDSKKFGSWDQNLMAEWHIRYGGRGVMIYWHVDKRSTCIYSQLKKCSSSEVANMIEGVLEHCTDMKVEKQYVDTHGQSEVAFAFCRLLGFDLMPRLKNISSQKLYLPDGSIKKELNNLGPILSRTIKWEALERQYDEMIKYTTALEQGTADPESILRRFTRGNESHPTYRALQELGKVVKTIFLCRYLAHENIRREIHEGLNVIENWNSANSFIFFGKSGEVSSNRLEEQELSVLALHLLQNSLVYVNTLMIQRIVSDNGWMGKLSKEDHRALSPLIYAHVNPYGKFELDMEKNLGLAV